MTEPAMAEPQGQERDEADEYDGEDLLTIAEAAEILKVSTVTLSRWRRQGRLPTLKVGPRAVRIRRSDLDLISQPYRGPVSSLDQPQSAPTPAVPSQPIAPPPPIAVPAERTLARAAQLRALILHRRKGEFLEPAGDDLGKLRDKRAKRRH